MSRVVSVCWLLLICNLQERTAADKEVLASSREHIAGVTYESLLDVFQIYPVDRSNTDQPMKLFNTCDRLSGYQETTHTDSRATQELVSKPCYSVLRNCRHEDSMGEFVHFCVSKSDQYRRFDYVVTNKTVGQRYGRKLTGKCPSSKFEVYYSHGTYYPCLCECESSERRVDRYFSLLDVVSDDDKVVTGFRFRKVGHVFYIQIQQGKLRPHRSIIGEAKWKDVESLLEFDLVSIGVSDLIDSDDNENMLRFKKNNLVYTVTSEQNTVLLDDLVGGPDEVLTGLRFRHVDQDLRLEIQVTPFHEGTGTLERNASRWLYNDIDRNEREEVKFQSSKLPNRREAMDIFSFGPKFIRFQVSDLNTDLGQTTVPFISLTEVVPGEPQPLSGAGIFHRGSSRSAGFLAPKVLFP